MLKHYLTITLRNLGKQKVYAYRITLSWQTFLLAGLSALTIALLAVSHQAVRAALADPVKSLRYE